MPLYAADLFHRSSSHDYSTLLVTLQRMGGIQFANGHWLLETRDDANILTKKILSHCAVGDGLFVIELTSATAFTLTGLGDDGKQWLLTRLKPGLAQEVRDRRITVN